MNVHIQTPYSLTKNLGAAYNKAMELIPDEDACCLIDGDVTFLTPDYGHILHQYANENTNAVLTCFTNRIHELAKGQRLNYTFDDIREDIKKLSVIADGIKQFKSPLGTTPLTGPVSGFLMVIPKRIWKQHKFNEDLKCLGVDNDFTNRVRAAGIPVLRMDGMLVWHSYRLLTGNKNHLL